MKKFKFTEIRNIPHVSGVYQIVNELDGKRYIGSSKDIHGRVQHHRSELRRNRHHSPHLQNAYNKYGEDKFYFSILEICENIRDTILFLEQKYLDLNPEYNISTNATCPINVLQTNETKEKRAAKLRGRKRSQEERKRVSNGLLDAKLGIPVNCYSLDGKYIKTYHNARAAQRELGGRSKGVVITSCCKGNNNAACGFMWRYDNGDHSDISPYKNNSMKVIEESKRPVLQLDDYGNVLNEFNSISDAARWLNKKYAISNIARCAKGYVKHAAGYVWKYRELDYEEV